MSDSALDEVKAFLHAHPDVETFELLLTDTNGIMRGKRVPRNGLASIYEEGLRLTASTFALDIWGNEVLDTGLVWETGDADNICLPIPETLSRAPWFPRPTGQTLMTMVNKADGQPYFGDPRNILVNVLDRFHEMKLSPVAAMELEFYLVDKEMGSDGKPRPPISPLTGQRQSSKQIYGIDQLSEFDPVLGSIFRVCVEQNLPADTAVAEAASGQYEINLNHL